MKRTFSRVARVLATIAVIALTASPSCMSLDSFLYTATPLTAYSFPYPTGWPTQFTVPDSLRTQQIYTAHDGTQVALVYARQPAPLESTSATVIYHHGQSDNLDRYWERVGILWGLGVNVVAYDYPGYGMTPGTPSEATVYATAYATVEWTHALGTEIDQSKVFQYGFSLGSGPATQMAYSTGPTRGLILEAAFTSIDALVADGALVVPRSFVMSNSFNNLSKIRHAAATARNGLLAFHGTADTYVQTRYSVELDQEVADGEATHEVPPGHHQLILIPGADHSEVPCVGPGDNPCMLRPIDGPYFTLLREFLQR
jgi:fermentation-respiration switch protein FrsA (DUF1100 family)